MNETFSKTALGVVAGGLNATSGGSAGQAQNGFVGTAQGLTSTSGDIQNCGSLGWFQYQQSPCCTYYYPYPVYPPAKPTVAEVIALYKKEFGKDWKRMFAQTVKVEAR